VVELKEWEMLPFEQQRLVVVVVVVVVCQLVGLLASSPVP
jgi:hypothetical protein